MPTFTVPVTLHWLTLVYLGYVQVELIVLRALSHYLLLPWFGGLSDTQQDWQQRSARLTLLLQRTLHDYVVLAHQLVRPDHHQQQQQHVSTPPADLLNRGVILFGLCEAWSHVTIGISTVTWNFHTVQLKWMFLLVF